ncbi:MAG: hypothetical protein SWX82_08770 [Cyanobacteriota bacterium]|nr:hypothetical protein [Cyanobacteriota bacterium]
MLFLPFKISVDRAIANILKFSCFSHGNKLTSDLCTGAIRQLWR